MSDIVVAYHFDCLREWRSLIELSSLSLGWFELRYILGSYYCYLDGLCFVFRARHPLFLPLSRTGNVIISPGHARNSRTRPACEVAWTLSRGKCPWTNGSDRGLTKQREPPPDHGDSPHRRKQEQEREREYKGCIDLPTSLYSLPLPSSPTHQHQHHDEPCFLPLENFTRLQYSTADRGRYSDSHQLHSASTST